MTDPDFDETDNVRYLVPPRRDRQDRPDRPVDPPPVAPPRRRGFQGLLKVRSRRLGTGPVDPGTGQDRPGTDLVPVRPAELERAIFEAELVDEPPKSMDAVHASPPVRGEVVPWRRDEQRQALVPAWIVDPAERRHAARWAVGHYRHVVEFHTIRLPVYGGRLLVSAPTGLGRLLVGVTTWVLDFETAAARQLAVDRGEVSTYTTLIRRRDERVRGRLTAVSVVLALAAALAVVITLAGPSWARWVALAAAVGGLGAWGRRKDKPLVDHPVTRARFERLTDQHVLRALAAAGLGGRGPKKAANGEEEQTAVGTPTFPQPIVRDGPGWLATVDLPRGRTAGDAAAKRDQLASGLDCSPAQVHVEAVPESARRIRLWVADVDPYTLPPRHSPLAKCPPTSVWDPQPLGAEPRGRVVRPPLIFASFLVGAVPRMGKTYAARALVAPAMLDPLCDLTVLDLKGGRDWKPCEELAVTYRSGDDEEDVAYALVVLDRIIDEARRRFRAFRELPDAKCPESKLTRELAADGLRPHVVVIDEVQNLLRHPIHGRDALPKLVWLAKTAPAAGVTLVLATQRPAAEVIPADLRDNCTVRVALRTMDWRSSDTILGASAASIGIESFSLQEQHKGVAVVRGVSNGRGGDAQTVRVDLLAAEDVARICAIGRQRRLDAGTLRGAAAHETDPAAVEVSVLDDVVAVWPGAQAKVWAETLLERLTALRPDLYEGMTAGVLTAALGRHGIGSMQVNKGKVNRRGYALADVRRAADSASVPIRSPLGQAAPLADEQGPDLHVSSQADRL